MKTKILSFALAVAASIGLASCDSDWQPAVDGGRAGQIKLSSISIEVDEAEEVLKRSSVDVSSFLVKIYKADGDGALVNQWTYAQMPEIFSLPVGDYRVDIASHNVQKAEWDAPLFLGSKTFSIADSEITDIGTVTCKFSSIKVSVRFTDELRAAMADDVEVTVVCNDEGTLTFTPAETRVGCFEAVEGSTTLAASFKGTVKGFKEDFHRIYEDVKAGQHRIITFGLRDSQIEPDPETGTIDPTEGVNVSVDVENENVGGSVDAEEDNLGGDDRPGKEEFGGGEDPGPGPGPDDPDASNVDFNCDLDLTKVHDVTPENCAKAIIDIVSKYPIENLVVDIESSSDDFNNILIAGGLGTSFDLANPATPALEATLSGFGLPVSASVKGQTAVEFDVSGLVGLLDNFSGTHNFKVTVTDAKGKTFDDTLKFRVP